MNWMHDAVLNGIGGVPCGAYEGMYKMKETSDKLLIKVKIYEFLHSGKYRTKALEDEYLLDKDFYSISEKREIILENKIINKDRLNMNKAISKLKHKILLAATGRDCKTDGLITKHFREFKKTSIFQQDHKNKYNKNDMVKLKSIERQKKFLEKIKDPERKVCSLTNKAIKMYYCMFKTKHKHIYLLPTDTYMIDTNCEPWLNKLKDA